ncbi:MAG: type II toxin-antitoxin system RelE/ParE family toxin [Nitriliruptoraceae bacterium]
MSAVIYQWHPEVIADFRELPEDLRVAYLEQIEAVKADPKLGEHLDRRASTGDLSAYRKVKFGHDTPRGPSHRIVYQLLPDSYTPSRFRVIAVRSRADVYNTAARRLQE